MEHTEELKWKIRRVERNEKVLVIATMGHAERSGGGKGQGLEWLSRRGRTQYGVAHGASGEGPTLMMVNPLLSQQECH